MERRIWVLCAPIFILLFTNFSFFKVKTYEVPALLKVTSDMLVVYPSVEEIETEVYTVFYSPFLEKEFIGFKEALGFKESQGNYFVTNTFGYLGKYQFGIGTLQMIGIYNATLFLNNPELQEKAFKANISRNKWILRREIKRYVGRWVDGHKVSESGILAAAHLAGAGNVKKYLRSLGGTNFGDANGTTIKYYMKKFSGYDISTIAPNKKAKI